MINNMTTYRATYTRLSQNSVQLRALRAAPCPPCNSVPSVQLRALRAAPYSPCSSVPSLQLCALRATPCPPCSSVHLGALRATPCSSVPSVQLGALRAIPCNPDNLHARSSNSLPTPCSSVPHRRNSDATNTDLIYLII